MKTPVVFKNNVSCIEYANALRTKNFKDQKIYISISLYIPLFLSDNSNQSGITGLKYFVLPLK